MRYLAEIVFVALLIIIALLYTFKYHDQVAAWNKSVNNLTRVLREQK